MRIELKPWNKSRVGNVILFVMLTLFFGYASIIIFETLLDMGRTPSDEEEERSHGII